jgi:hypothetical protein
MKWLAAVLLCLCPLAAQEDVAFTLFRYSPIQRHSELQSVHEWYFKLDQHARGKQKLSKAERLRIMGKLLPNRSDIMGLRLNGYRDIIKETLEERLNECIRGHKRFRPYDAKLVAELIVKEYL